MEFQKGMKIMYDGSQDPVVKNTPILKQKGIATVKSVQAGWIIIKMDKSMVEIGAQWGIMESRCRALDDLIEGNSDGK